MITPADRTTLAFAAAVIESHVDGRHRSQAAAELRAMAARVSPAEHVARMTYAELVAAIREDVWAG